MTLTTALIIPTRGRPHAASELILASRETDVEVDIHFVVDSDDAEIDAYHALIVTPNVFVHIADPPPGCMNAALNAFAPFIALSYDVLGFMGDDHRPRTKGYGDMVAKAMKTSLVVWGNDLVHGEAIPTACFLRSDAVQTLGYFAPPDQKHLYLDNCWKAWGDATARQYLPKMIIEHLHPIAGKAEWDEGYVRVNDPAVYDFDKRAYEAYIADGRFDSDIKKLKELL